MSVFNSIMLNSANLSGKKPLFIGQNVGTVANGNAISLDLTEGSSKPIDVQEGDLIVALHAAGSSGDILPDMHMDTAASAYMNTIVSSRDNDTYDPNMKIYVGRATTNVSTFAVDSIGNTSVAVTLAVMVFRNVTSVNQIKLDESASSDDPNFHMGTNLKRGDIVVGGAVVAHILGSAVADNFEQHGTTIETAYFDKFITDSSSDTYDCTFGLGYKIITDERAFKPVHLDSDLSGSSSAFVSSTLVLR
jgi:hypothetical protein